MTLKQAIKTIYRTTPRWHVSRSRMIPDEAQLILAGYTPDPSTNCVTNNTLDPQYDLQIIIPAYNAEKYIVQCLESALHQDTKYSYLITVVNDGSTDRTPEIIESYHVKFPERIEVINQENRGFSGARNTALKHLKGRYITFVDSDDLLEEGAIESLLSCAEWSGSDMVQGRMAGIYKRGGYQETSYQSIIRLPLGKVYRAEMFEHFQFPEGYWFEDTPI